MVTLPAQRNLFGSCSDDGTVRLWDASRLQGHAYVNRFDSQFDVPIFYISKFTHNNKDYNYFLSGWVKK
jgi:WD40 repeat protein